MSIRTPLALATVIVCSIASVMAQSDRAGGPRPGPDLLY